MSRFSFPTIQLQLIFLWVLKTLKSLPLTPRHQSLTAGAKQVVGDEFMKLDKWVSAGSQGALGGKQSWRRHQSPGRVQGITQVTEACLLWRCPETGPKLKTHKPRRVQVGNGSKFLLL